MTYPIIFMDECGYTGSDLCNQEQTIFTIATLNCTDIEAEEVKGEFFKEVKSRELKHSALLRYKKQQSMVIEFIRYLSANPKLIKVSVVHKRYAIVTKMVDIVVEELAHEDGVDLYKKGANIAYSNVLYYVIPAMAGEEFFNKMLFYFQELIRTRSVKSYEKFFGLFFTKKLPEDVDRLLAPFKAFHLRIGKRILSFPAIIFEIALGCAANLMAQWSEYLKNDMVLIHDTSSNMAKNKDLWDLFVSPTLPSSTVGYDRRKVTFPIGVRETIFENSKNKIGLQLVDVIAGAFTKWGSYIISGKRENLNYEKELDKFFPGNFSGTFIWPSTDISPQDLGTDGEDMGSLIDHVAQIIKK